MTHAEGRPNRVVGGLGITWSRALLALFFSIGGLMHFVAPGVYVAIVPPWLPNSKLLVLLSGVAEIMGGLGILHPATRRLAGWGLIALLVAVFPANVQMLHLAYVSHASALWKFALWLRLPLQIPLVWWVWRVAARRAP
ncbi:MAG: hypothetical protein ABI889_01375 [Gemmatimonadota bacterium]